MSRPRLTLLLATLALATPAWAQSTINIPAKGPDGRLQWTSVIEGKETPAPAIDMGDDETILRLLDEGKNRNQVMQHLRHLTHEIGPRLTGSRRLATANEWCRDQYTAWGLTNAHIEEWGTMATQFNRGPSTGKLLLKIERRRRDADSDAPKVEYETLREFEFSTMAWTKGTDGPLRGPVIREPATEEEYEAIKDKLPGAWVLLRPPSSTARQGIRRGPRGWLEMAVNTRDKVAEGTSIDELPVSQKIIFSGAAGFITTSRDERVWTSSVPRWRERKPADVLPDLHVMIRGSDYDALNSRLADGEPVEVEFNLQHELIEGPIPCANTIAEIRGTEWPDEVVIISAHLDSWDGPGSQGCLDNGTGSAVTLEAARILMAANAKPKRTIRFINWTGEEQGLLGSRAYVKMHKDSLDKISAVFVDDGGTNTQGGLPAASNMVEMLAAATAPTNNQFYSETDGKFLNVNIRDTGRRIGSHGSSDHASFNAVGVPGFFWDEIGRSEYTFGWHTQNDKFEQAIEEYLVQSSTNSAITAYRLACAPTLLPRELPAEKKDEPKASDEGSAKPAVDNPPAAAPGPTDPAPMGMNDNGPSIR